MSTLSSLSDEALLARLPLVVRAERAASADVIAHLAELDRRRLYLDQACSSLNAYCIERLGYSEEGAFKRVRVARLVQRVPKVIEELATGAIHLTGLFLLARVLTPGNADGLLAESRGKSRAEIEKVIATWFPRGDVRSSLKAVAEQHTLATVECGRLEPTTPPGVPQRLLGSPQGGRPMPRPLPARGSSRSRPPATGSSSRPTRASGTSSSWRDS